MSSRRLVRRVKSMTSPGITPYVNESGGNLCEFIFDCVRGLCNGRINTSKDRLKYS